MKSLVVLILLCIKYAHSESCNEFNPVVEGTSYILSRFIDKSKVTSGNFQWKFKDISGVDQIVTKCQPDKTPPCQSVISDDQYTSTMEDYTGSKYNVTLTIHNMTRIRDHTTWSWYDGSNKLGECDLDVYSFQVEPVCNDLKLSSDEKFVLLKCSYEGIYPRTECRFTIQAEGDTKFLVLSKFIGTKMSTRPGTIPPRTMYHDFECSLRYPVRRLKAGKYTYSLFVYLDHMTYKDTGKQTLNLRKPRVELKNCPNDTDSTKGYIGEWDTRTCQCTLKDAGKPSGAVTWTNGDFSPAKNVVNDGRTSTLSLTYDPKYAHYSYTCFGSSDIGDSEYIHYMPKFAYGPKDIFVYLKDNTESTIINKCEPTTSFLMECSVSSFDVRPLSVTFTGTASDNSSVILHDKTALSAKFKVFPEKGGKLIMTCQASNSIFSDLKRSESKVATVQVPPTSRPIMSANGGSDLANGTSVTVKVGDRLDIKCRVDGGHPAYTSMDMKCTGGQNTNFGGSTLSIPYVYKEDNNKICVCQGVHLSGCYDKTSILILNVQD